MRIGIVGYGNMGEALAVGLAAADPSTSLVIYEKLESRRKAAGERAGIIVAASLSELCASAELLVIAVKPQSLGGLAPELKAFTRGKRVISIVAGTPIAYFQRELATEQVVRFMPNLAAKVGRAAVGVSFPSSPSADFRTAALSVASAIGTPFELPEELLASITGLSGSGIAFALAFLHDLALGGVRTGLAYPAALAIALETVEGAALLVRKSGEHPISLLSKVTSPAGTTIEGLRALEGSGFAAGVMDAVTRACERARELEG